jgi:cell division protein FtsW (lipid II flippase)
LRLFLIGLPLIGMLSMPVSWLLLEKMKWALIPQFQPMRALLFVTALALLLAAIAGCHAARERRFPEAFLWFALAYLIPTNARILSLPSWNKAAVVIALAIAACLLAAARMEKVQRFGTAALAIAAFFAIPVLARVSNYPYLHTPELTELSSWARASTPTDSVFLFPDFGQGLQPGIFRSEALRAVYVDWKGGGQVNYLRELAQEWWSRWQAVMSKPFDPRDTARYRGLGIDYLVVKPKDALAGETSIYSNSGFVVYALRQSK